MSLRSPVPQPWKQKAATSSKLGSTSFPNWSVQVQFSDLPMQTAQVWRRMHLRLIPKLLKEKEGQPRCQYKIRSPGSPHPGSEKQHPYSETPILMNRYFSKGWSTPTKVYRSCHVNKLNHSILGPETPYSTPKASSSWQASYDPRFCS